MKCWILMKRQEEIKRDDFTDKADFESDYRGVVEWHLIV